MKYISRITALLLVLMMLTPTFASALTLGTATQGDLNKLYQEASEDGVIYLSAGLLGHWSGLSAFGNLAYKDLYRFQWFNEDGQILPCFNDPWVTRVSNTMAEQKFYCVATDATGNELLSPVYVVPAADISNVEDYWSLLHDDRFLDALGAADTLTIYRLMTDIWNVSMPDGKNLAESVVAQWWSEREETYSNPDLLCSCVVSGAVASDECVLHPNSDLHVNGCSWKQPEISASADVSTPESLLTLNSVVLAAEERPDVDAYAWQNYVYDPAIAGMRWAVVEYVQDTNLYTIQINKESIQTAYRVVIETTDYNLFESKPLYLGGYDFFNWILTNADIQAWMADDSVTLADVVARYNAAADEEDRTNTEDYTYGEEGESVNLKVPQGAFAEDYVMEFAEVAAERVEQLQNAVMAQMGATSTHVAQVLMALDISFASLANRANKLQPNAPVTLTFQVDTTGLDEALKYLYVYHIANDGTPEVVAGPIDAAQQEIQVEAEAFSEYLVMATSDACIYCQNHEYCFYEELMDMTHDEQYDYLQTLNGNYVSYMQDYVRHIAAGAPAILCTCVNYANGDRPNEPMDGSHGTTCPWSDNARYVIGVFGTKIGLNFGFDVYEEYKWYEGTTNGAVVSTAATYEVTYTKNAMLYICLTKDSYGNWTEHWFRVQADMTMMSEYLAYIGGVYQDMDDLSFDRHAIYDLMTTTWNVSIDDYETTDDILAKEILVYWKRNMDPDLGEELMFCTCCIGEGDIVSDQIMLHPDAAHYEACPWWNGLTLEPDAPVNPDQPPLYNGNPQGNQYSETLEHTLPMDENRAVILQTGARAILTSTKGSASAVWQVYTGEEWVDIQGDNTNVIEVTEAKLNSIFALTGIAQLRYFDVQTSIVLDEVSVTTKEIAGGEYVDLPVTFSMMTRDVINGEHNDGDDTYCTIVINYVYENGEIAEAPFVADLKPGSGYTKTVEFPTKTGYDPYLADVKQNSLALGFEAIDSDYQYTVVYKPAMVNYTVIHYHQNTDNDEYAEFERETKQGLTKSVVPGNLAKLDNDGNLIAGSNPAYKGFYKLLYETPTIAADDSTKVEIYYDRYYYLMNFDLDDGYGTEPVYARYGADLGEIVEPTKPGYTFQGWYLYKVGNNVTNSTNVVDLPTTMPNENRTYKAIWKQDATAKVSIVFWGENADDEGYSYIKTGIAEMEPGSTYTYSNDLVMQICGLEQHTHTAACSTPICGQTEHTHTHGNSCITISGAVISTDGTTDPGDNLNAGSNNGVYRTGSWSIFGSNYEYWVKSGDYYYKITSGVSSSNWQNVTVTYCGKTEHTHSGSCYSCGYVAHTHSSACNQTGSGMTSSLWTLRTDKNQTVTVAADGSTVVNVYYDRKTFTLTFKVSSKTVKTITDKWGAAIQDQFPIVGTNGTTYRGAEWKVPDGCKNFTAGTNVLSIDIMPPETITFTRNDQDDSATLYYYVEALPNQGTHTYNGKSYTLYKTVYLPNSGRLTESEEHHPIAGFTKGEYSPSNVFQQVSKTMYLYYTRNTFAIQFYNPTELIKTETGIPYQANLGSYDFTPTADQAPDKYEPGSVRFAGWYLNPECTGEQYVLSNHTMPASADNKSGDVALSLYAKWEKVTLKVEFYLDKTHYEAGQKLSTHPDLPVRHGEYLTKPADPANGDYTFVGWFYMDGNEEKAFDFANMPVKQDMQVYGKWYSNVLKEFVVYYKVKDANGNVVQDNGKDLEIAARTTGSVLAGATKTFDAKTGSELNTGYQEGYFPEVKSHSLTANIVTPATPGTPDGSFDEWYIKVDEDGNPVLDENGNQQIIQGYTFWYVRRDAVPYVVHYVTDKQPATDYGTYTDENGKVWYKVAASKTVSDNKKAVVTETFATVNGMMADAYQKRLVLDPNASAEDPIVTNAIIFYYTEDTTHAYYKMSYYLEGGAAGTWEEKEPFEAKGDIGSTYTITPKTFTGFTLDKTVEGTLESGKLTADGLHLKLYYKRNSYPYYVRYLDKNTYEELATTKERSGLYQQEVQETAITIPNYTAVAPTTQTISIRVDDGQGETRVNVITFLYTENSVNLKYVAVTRNASGGWNEKDSTGGTVKVGTNTYGAEVSEPVSIKNGSAAGTTASVSSNTYKFVGWYTKNAAGDYVPVTSGDGTVEGNKFTPTKADNALWVDGTTYYALFDWNVSTLTVQKTGMQSGESAVIQVEITNSGSTDTYTIVLNQATQSVVIGDVLIGSTYTVTELDAWTWRYKNGTVTYAATPDSEGNYKIVADAATNTVTVENTKSTNQWLSDESAVKNDLSSGDGTGHYNN